MNKFSVIVPTYTGIETIEQCFESIFNQSKTNYELIIVIDGPSVELADICNEQKVRFEAKGINVLLRQFDKNKGRFIARLEGARHAKTNHLLFVDDRITFEANYFSTIMGLQEEIVIPNVNEAHSANFVSGTLHALRIAIYGKKKFGSSFKSYYIDAGNFESSPKGTTSLRIAKKLFIEACEAISASMTNTKYVSEDTRVFKYLIENGSKIYKSNEAVISYTPRDTAWAELLHVYHRGPRFVDYYSRKGTRFRPLLILLGILALLIPFVFMTNITLAIFLILLTFLLIICVGAYMARGINGLVKYTIGITAILIFFALGLLKGFIVIGGKKIRP